MPAAARARLAGPWAFAVNAACSAVSAPSTSLKAAALMIHVGRICVIVDTTEASSAMSSAR